MRHSLLAAYLLTIASSAHGLTFALEPGSDLVGEVETVIVGPGDTLLDIARAHDLGYNEIVAANPQVDPWLPEAGVRVVVPKRFVLPSAPREGLVINLAEMRLYYFPAPADGEASAVVTYPIGIGQEGWSTPLGKTEIIEKRADPVWTVPDSILAEYAAEGRPLPKHVPPGPDNPLGEYAMRLSYASYLIHGTNKPYGVGRRVSHGCIRMYPEDIKALFETVPVGTSVRIIDQAYKIGRDKDALYIEAHQPLEQAGQPPRSNLSAVVAAIGVVVDERRRVQAQNRALDVASRHSGVPSHIVEVESGPPIGREGWLVQLGAFADRDNASRLASSLRALALPVSVQARASDGYCHVFLGPYAGKAPAQEALGRVASSFSGLNGRVLSADQHGLLAECVP